MTRGLASILIFFPLCSLPLVHAKRVRFTQAEVPSRHTPGGVGIGLAITRHLVELHNGTIKVASGGEGQAAISIVKLPFNQPAQPNSDA